MSVRTAGRGAGPGTGGLRRRAWVASSMSGAVIAGFLVVVGAVAPAAPAATTSTCGSIRPAGYAQSDVATGLDTPVSVAVGPAGNVFAGDEDTGDVLEFKPSGGSYTKTVIASGALNGPFGLAVQDNGVVWATQSSNNLVDTLTPSGSTYTHSDGVFWGIYGPMAVAVDPDGTVYAAAASGKKIVKMIPGVTPDNSSLPVFSTAGSPWGVAVDGAKNVYSTDFVDANTSEVVKSTPSGSTYDSVVIPTSGLSSPHGIAVDSAGVLYIADTGNDRIVTLTPSGSGYTQGVVPAAGLSGPSSVAVDSAKNLYVADTGNDRVVKLSPMTIDAIADTDSTTVGNDVTTDVLANDTSTGSLGTPTIAANPAHGTTTVNANGSITYTPGAGYSGTDAYSYAVRDPSGSVCDLAKVTITVMQDNSCGPLGTTGASTQLPIETGTDYPNYFDVDADGNIFVTDSEAGEIVRLTPSASGYVRSVVATGVGNVTAIAVDDSNDAGVLWVVRYPGQLLKLTPSGSQYTIADTYSGGLLANIGGVDVAPDGDIFVSINATSFGAGGVVRLAAGSGMAQSQVIGGLEVPHQVVVDAEGAVYVATYTKIVKAVDTGSGWTVTNAVTGLGSAEGVAVDSAGTIWIGTAEDPGVWTATPSGSGYNAKQLYAPWGAEFASTLEVAHDGTLFVSDFNHLWTFGPTTLRMTDDTATVTAPQTVTTDVRANDHANVPLGMPSVVSGPAHGTASVNADGTIAYTPAVGFSGTDSYSYQVEDSASPAQVCGVATVTITVAPATACGPLTPRADLGRVPVTTGLTEPTGIAVGPDGVVYISDVGTGGNGKVIAWDPDTGPSVIDSTAGIDPQGIAVDVDGNVYYADEGEHEIVKLTRTGSSYTRSVLAQGLQRPSGVAVDADGNVYFSENSSGHVHKLTPSGGGYTVSLIGSGLERPRGVAVDADGNVFVADWADEDKIIELSPSGTSYTKSIVALGLDNPFGVAVQPDGTLIVGDAGHDRVLRLIPDGTGYRRQVVSAWGDHAPTWVANTDHGAFLAVDQDAAEVVRVGSIAVTAANDSATTTSPDPVSTDVRANDTASAGVTLAAPTVVSSPAHGSASVNADGTITYTPVAGFAGTDSYRYRVTDDGDPAAVCASAVVSVTVTGGTSGSGPGGPAGTGSGGGGSCASPGVSRIGGANRYDTAALVSRWAHPKGASVVFVATGADFPDALGGGVAAGRADAPVLLVKPDTVPAETAAELRRLKPTRIVLLGGTSAVTAKVAAQLESFATTVDRIGGADRYATAAAIAAESFTSATTAYLATGAGFADALSGVPAAVVSDAPLLLAHRGSVPQVTLDALRALGVTKVVILGGPSAVSVGVADRVSDLLGGASHVVRLAGADRYATSVAIADHTFPGVTTAKCRVVLVATGQGFADALTGGPAAGRLPGPVLLTPSGELAAVTGAHVGDYRTEQAVVLGGTAAIADHVKDQLEHDLNP